MSIPFFLFWRQVLLCLSPFFYYIYFFKKGVAYQLALFKILSNMDNTSQPLPSKANKGYCYFDVNTGKWWVDIAGNGTQDAISSETHESGFNRMPLNAHKADMAVLSKATENAVYEVDDQGETVNQYLNIAKTYGTNLLFNNNILSLKNIYGTSVSNVTFGALASVNSVSGGYTPAGTNSRSAIHITPATDQALQLSQNGVTGTVPTLTMAVDNNEVLSFNFNAGSATTLPTYTNISVWTGYTAASSYAEAQSFTGIPATITLSPVSGGAQNGDNVYF